MIKVHLKLKEKYKYYKRIIFIIYINKFHKPRCLTDNIFPAIALQIPIGAAYEIIRTILITTSNIAEKKSTTILPRSPIVPKIVPKNKQNTTIPIVFVPYLNLKNFNN